MPSFHSSVQHTSLALRGVSRLVTMAAVVGAACTVVAWRGADAGAGHALDACKPARIFWRPPLLFFSCSSSASPSLGLLGAGAGTKLAMADRKAQQKPGRKNQAAVEASVAPSPEEVEVAIEEATGVKFLKKLSPPGSTKMLTFVGAGVREKAIAFIKVKVYAVGFYADPEVSAHLAAWKGKAGVEVAKDESFFKAFLGAPVTKSIVIILVRDVDGATFWGALDEALVPRLKAANAGRDGEIAMTSLAKVFQGRPFKQGTNFLLNWVQPGTLEISITTTGSAIPTPDFFKIESAPLVAALFDVYLGPVPVAPSAKTALGVQTAIAGLI